MFKQKSKRGKFSLLSRWFNAKHAMIQRSDEAKAGKVIGSTGGRHEEVDAETANSLSLQ